MTGRAGLKTHYVAAGSRRTACGRDIDTRATTRSWTTTRELVDCALCRRTLGLYGNGKAPVVLEPEAAERTVSVMLTESQVFTLRHLVAMEQEALDEYEEMGIFKGENAPTREQYDQEMTDIELALFRAVPRL